MNESKEILLSISILMSGRKETRKCLDSLVPIMEAIPCELILVDTGCDDKTRAILKEYTDIIVPFKWCNDFSKARNTGLRLAKGKWFMFMDDDEWFVDTSDIIEFFRSGEYKEYRCATYVVRNYLDMEESAYSDHSTTRMTQIFDNTRFESSIHETITPVRRPVKVLGSYVKHFGYVYKTKKDLYDGSNRNLVLLEKEIQENPYDYRIISHTLQEYKNLEEFDSVIKMALDCISKSNDEEHRIVSPILGAVYGFLLDAYVGKYRYEDCLKCIEKIKNDSRINDITKAFVYRSETICCYYTGDYNRAVEAFNNYIMEYNSLGNDLDEINLQKFLITGDVFQQYMLRSTVFFGIMSDLKIGNDVALNKYFDLMGFDDSDIFVHNDFVNILMDYILSKANYEEYICYIEQAIKNERCLHQVANYIEKIETKIDRYYDPNNCEDDNINEEEIEDIDVLQTKFDNAISLFSTIDNNYWYCIYLTVLNYRNTLDKEECVKNIESLFSCIVDKFNIDNKVWDIVIEVGVEFSTVAGDTDFDSWRVGIDRWVINATEEDVHKKEILVSKWVDETDYRYLYLKMKVDEARLRKYSENDECTFIKLEDNLFSFINSTYEFCISVYNESVLNEHTEVLPRECALVMKLFEIKELRKSGDNKQVIRVLKECVDIYEPFNSVIKLYVQKLGDEIKQEKSQQVQDDVSEELAQLAIALKLKVREFIENGNIVEARVVLNQLIQCVPDDEEAKEILLMLDE